MEDLSEDYCSSQDEQQQEGHLIDSDASDDAGDDTDCDDEDGINYAKTTEKDNKRERFSGQWRATDVFDPELPEFITDEEDSDSRINWNPNNYYMQYFDNSFFDKVSDSLERASSCLV